MLQDPDEYFRPPGGLLTFDLHLGNLVEQSSPYLPDAAGKVANTMKLDSAKDGHFKLVNLQIRQVQQPVMVCMSEAWQGQG